MAAAPSQQKLYLFRVSITATFDAPMFVMAPTLDLAERRCLDDRNLLYAVFDRFAHPTYAIADIQQEPIPPDPDEAARLSVDLVVRS